MNNFRFQRLIAMLLIMMGGTFAYGQSNDTANYPYWVEMMQDQKINFFDVQRAFETYWEGREVTKGSGYKPFRRWEYMMRQRVAPDGTRPAPDRDMRAFSEYYSQPGSRQNMAGNWSSLGPFTVPSGYNGYRGLGRLNAIAFHPLDPDIIYVGAPSGGFWITYDHGQNWETHTDVLPTLGVSAIVVDYENPDIIFIGTGDRDANDAPGLGVWKSMDGGISWEPSNTGMGNVTVGKLIMHPQDNGIMLASTSGGVFRSANGGISWTQSIAGNFKDIKFKPDDPDIVYATREGNFYRSENNGINFSLITNGLPGGNRGVIGVTPANPDMVYFILTNADSYRGLYRSTDAGLSFSVRSTTPNIMSWGCNGGSGGQAWYNLDMAIDPHNPDIVYVGGVNIFKSTNGGQTWFIVGHWWGDCGVTAVHADLHVFEYSPHNNWLYAGNDGGIYWTANSGTNWTEITNGLVISQAYKIGQSRTMRNFVINGYQDNGSSVLNGSTWINVSGGDGMECAYDPTNHLYAYSTLYYGSIYRIVNNNNQGHIAGNNTNGINESGGWVTPFLIDDQDPNTMFIGYKNVWRSNNIKAGNINSVSWTRISEWGTTNLDQLRQSPANTNVMYASTGNKLYVTQGAHQQHVNWSNITTFLPAPNHINAIETSPFDENVVYIAQQNQIYKSTNMGQSWQQITGTLPDVNINSIAYYRNSNEGLYLGTDIGIFYKDDELDDWISFSNGFPTSGKVTEIEIYYDPGNPAGDAVRAGTYGRGLWESEPYYGTPQASFGVSANATTVDCPIDFYDQSGGVPHTWLWTFEGGTPSSSTLQHPTDIVYSQEGTYSVTLTITNPSGSSTLTLPNFVSVDAAATPEVYIAASDTVGCHGLVVKFMDESTNCPLQWAWSFEPDDVVFLNGTSSSSSNPEVQFVGNQPYSVSLTVSNFNGSSSKTFPDFIKTGGHTLPYLADFNHSTLDKAGWMVINPGGAVTWGLTDLEDGRRVPWMNFFNYNFFHARDMMVSPPVNLSDYENAWLMFEHAYAQRHYQRDSLIVSISTDCGDTWQRIYANGPNGSGIFETAEPTAAFFLPQSTADWCIDGYGARCTAIDLTEWIGHANVKFRFETYNHFGNNLYLDNIRVSQTTAVAELDKPLSSPLIFPNPATSELTIILPDEMKTVRLSIVDVNGRQVLGRKLFDTKTIINLPELSTGVYLIKLEHDSGIYTQKHIIQNPGK